MKTAAGWGEYRGLRPGVLHQPPDKLIPRIVFPKMMQILASPASVPVFAHCIQSSIQHVRSTNRGQVQMYTKKGNYLTNACLTYADSMHVSAPNTTCVTAAKHWEGTHLRCTSCAVW